MRIFWDITKFGILALLVLTNIGYSQGNILENTASPDKSRSLLSIAKSIDKPENPTIVQLKRSSKTVWSKTFMAKYVGFSWSPSSRYALIDVSHDRDGILSKELYLLDTDDEPRLYDLHFSAIDSSIGKSLGQTEDFDFGSSQEPPFGWRGGGYDIDDAAWITPQEFKFEYDYESDTKAAIAQLVLRIEQNSPALHIQSIYPAKNANDLDQIIKRVRAQIHNQ